MTEVRHLEVGEYLRHVQRLMSDVPKDQRDAVLSEVEAHIDERLAELPHVDEADFRNVLDSLGDPEDIASDARERLEVTTTSPRKSNKGTTRILVIAVAGLVGVALVLAVRGALTVNGSPFDDPRRVITSEQLDRVRPGDDRADVTADLGGAGEPGSLVTGLVDTDSVRLEETPSDVPRQHYGQCWIYSVTGSGVGAQAGVCFVAGEVVYKRIETPQ